MGGWIKLYDKMLNWEWYGNTNVVRVFLHCLLKANYQPKVWQGIKIERGQFITSVATMADELGLTPKQVRGALGKLKTSNNVAIKGANKYSIVTICNYDSYQTNDDAKGQTTGRARRQSKGQTEVTQEGNNYRYTDNTNNTDIQNDIKSTTDVVPKDEPTKKRFIKPTIEEIQAYCTERGNGISAERFFAYYEANGWRVGRNPMKDWRAAVRTWEQQDGGRVKRQQRESTEQEERARFEAQMEIERKKDVERRRAAEEQEIEEYRQKELKRINDIIYGNNENNDNNK